MSAKKDNPAIFRHRYKGNEITIEGSEDKPVIKINDVDIKGDASVSSRKLFTSPLTYNFYTSPLNLARGMIDIEFALKGKTLGFIRAELKRRRNIAHLLARERAKFQNAVLRLKEQGRYDKYIEIHKYAGNLGYMGPAFLPWNRVFCYTFEQELQSIDSEVSLPYWDSTDNNLDGNDISLVWRNDFLGKNGKITLSWDGLDEANHSWTIRRNDFNMITVPVDKNSFNLDRYSYTEFCQTLENTLHNSTHVFLGGADGDQSSFATAVNDPFFFLVQCNMDRLWMQWQQNMKDKWLANNAGTKYPASQTVVEYYWDKSDEAHTWNYPPNRHNLEDIMWPWDGSETHIGGPNSAFSPWKDGMEETYTPRMMLNHHDWGYVYDEETLADG